MALDPNEDVDMDNLITIAEDSVSTYKSMKKVAKEFFSQRRDVKKTLIQSWKKVIPVQLCNDKLLSALFQYDFKQNKDTCKVPKFDI